METPRDVLFERWGVALDAAKIGIWDWRIDTDETVFDDRYYEMAGYRPGAFAANYAGWRARVHPEDIERVETDLQAHLAGELPAFEVEFRFRRADGGWMWIAATGRIVERDADGAPKRMVGIHLDISRVKQADELVRSFRSATEAATGRDFFSALARHLSEIFELDYAWIGELVGDDGDRVRTRGLWARGARSENFTYDLAGTPCERAIGESVCVHPSGVQEAYPQDLLLVEMGMEAYVGASLIDPEGRVVGLIAVGHGEPLDPSLTARLVPLLEVLSGRVAAELLRLRAESSLRRREEDLRITLESIGDAVIATDAEGRVVRMNPVAETLTDWGREDARGRLLREVFQIENDLTGEPCANPVERVLATGEVVSLSNHTVLVARDGTRRQIADSGAPIRDRGGRVVGVVLVFRDVTEQYRVQEQLRHSQRMDAVGRLAGGIAHDFNNMLGGILGYGELLTMQLEAGTDAWDFARSICTTAERAGALTSNLLAFSRRGQRSVEVFDVHAEVLSVKELLSHTLPRNISIAVETGTPRTYVEGDPVQVQSAILNLAVNARDAMPEGGELVLRTTLRGLDEAAAAACGVAPGDYVQIEVADTGTGMESEVLDRIFDPYFTTKERGEGTGLGLAAVYGTAREHGGHVLVESEPSRGSVFRLLLPVSADEPVTRPLPAPHLGGSLTVLVVDDEEAVRRSTAAMLRRAGHEVHEAADGASGLALFAERREEIDLVVLDVAMPGLDGAAVFRDLRELDPAARVVVATGFVDAEPAGENAFPGRAGLLRKPFRGAELLAAITRAMGHGGEN